MRKGEAARVHVREVPVRELTPQDSEGRFSERPLVVGDPAAGQEKRRIHAGRSEQNEHQNVRATRILERRGREQRIGRNAQ